MSKSADGGPAFPRQHTVSDANDPGFKLGHEGMMLRDWFAGQALAGWTEAHHRMAYDIHERTPNCPEIAAVCYWIADAMLAERDREK